MKINFSNDAIGFIVSNLEPNYMARVNKAGNITVKHNHGKEYWTLYAQQNGHYLWRHFEPSGYYCYPLNMKNRKDIEIHRIVYNNKEYKCVYYDFKKHAEFNTLIEAVEYFKGYLKKYRNGKVY